jgi:ankyrin repeat protein
MHGLNFFRLIGEHVNLAIGIVEIYRLDPTLARDQAIWLAVGVGCFVALTFRFKLRLPSGLPCGLRLSQSVQPLHSAAAGRHHEVCRVLLAAGADVNAKDFIQDTPYLYAAAEGRVEILKLALAAGADLKDTNRYRGTGLIPAAHHGHVEAVKLLLATAIDKDHVNNLGWTALLEAVILGDGGAVHTEIVQLLTEAGANVNIADRDGVTPLAHARKSGYSEMVRILSAAGSR